MSTDATADAARTPTFTELVFSDFRRYRSQGRPSWLRVLKLLPSDPGMLASLLVRAQQCLHGAGRVRAAHSLRTLGNVLIGADFGAGMQIGRGLMLVHPVGTTIGYGLVIGDNVTFAGGVTCAARYYDPGEDQEQAFATIGDDVVLGAGAVLVGGVHIGRNAMVGANSVVLSDVPQDAVVIGNPARRVGTRTPEETA